MATSPAPDAAAPPGMCPGIAVLGGGGDGGDGSGDGSGDGDGSGGGGKGKGKNGKGDGKGGAGCGKGSGADGAGCPAHHGGGASGKGSAGDPVDVVTGAMFTTPEEDCVFGGPLPLRIERSYRSDANDRDVGLGFGWSHSLAWEVIEGRSGFVLLADDGAPLEFGQIEDHTGVVGQHGWILGREGDRVSLGRTDDTTLFFGDPAPIPGGRRYRLLSIEDKTDNRITLEYSEGRLVRVIDCVGRVVDVIRGAGGRIERLSTLDPRNGTSRVALVTFRHDDRGDLVETTDADGAKRHFTYDDEHRITSQTTPNGTVFHYRHDRKGRCVESWGQHGGKVDPSLSRSAPEFLADGETRAKGIHHIQLTYGDEGYSEVMDSVTIHRYFGNRFGKCDKAVSKGGVFSREYDRNGHILLYVDALDGKTVFERDYRGRELKVTDPIGRVTTIHRYLDGSIREIIDAAGGVTRVTFGEDRMSLVDPIGASYSVRYDRRGQIVERALPNGTIWQYSYDEQGNLVEMVAPGGRRTTATYDGWGRRTSIREVDGSVAEMEITRTGKIVALREAGVTQRWEYDGEGNVIAAHDASGQITRMTYGALGRLHETRFADGGAVRLRYDREGRMVEVENARGEVHSIDYDLNGMRVRERTFDGRELRFSYDALGRMLTSTDGSGARTDYEWDPAGQLVKQTYPDDSDVSFKYDLLGDVIESASNAGNFRFERNAVGWIVGDIQEVSGEAISVRTDYDLMGNPVSRKTSLGHTVSYARNALGACTALTLDGAETVHFQHDLFGRETGRLLPRGGRVDTEYGPLGLVTRRRVHCPVEARAVTPGEPEWVGAVQQGTTFDRAYQYAPTQELSAVWDSREGIRKFEYDPVGRLLAVVPENARPALFAYDVTGNLMERDVPHAREYGPGDRLLRRGDTEFLWSDAGQIVERRTRSAEGVTSTRYEWSAAGMLQKVERPDGVWIEFAYDPWARRVGKRVTVPGSGVARQVVSYTRFAWDGVHLLHEVKRGTDESGAFMEEERAYLFEDIRTVPIAHRDTLNVAGRVSRGPWYHYLNDTSGAPEALVDDKGEIACDLVRTPWGDMTPAPGHKTTTPLRFRGQYADAETGLSYNRYRYYDPDLGRYISSDPIEIVGGLNLFAYAMSCPTSAIDVAGLMGTSMLTVIKQGDTVVATGLNADPSAPKGPFNTGKGCAEVNALNAIAKPGESAADVKARMIKDKMTMETYQISDKDRARAPGQAMKGKLPDSAKGVCPCGKCGNMIRGKPKPGSPDPPFGGPDMTSQVIANNREVPGKGSMRTWNGQTEFGS